jgi:hypothetical protein
VSDASGTSDPVTVSNSPEVNIRTVLKQLGLTLLVLLLAMVAWNLAHSGVFAARSAQRSK